MKNNAPDPVLKYEPQVDLKVESTWHPKLMVIDPDDPTQFKLRLQLSELMPDRTQYKPYGISYAPEIWVEVTVALDEVKDFSAEWVVLTPAGIAHVADQLATALDEMHDDFRNRSRNF